MSLLKPPVSMSRATKAALVTALVFVPIATTAVWLLLFGFVLLLDGSLVGLVVVVVMSLTLAHVTEYFLEAEYPL